jgi:hypothetical protein
VLEHPGRRPTEQGAQSDAEDGADKRDDHGLGADHRPHLTALHANRPEQAKLPPPLHDRQRQRADDAEQPDHRRQTGQRAVDRGRVVDLLDVGLVELGPVVDLHPGVIGRDAADRRPGRGGISRGPDIDRWCRCACAELSEVSWGH